MIAWSQRNTRHVYMRFCCASFGFCYVIRFSWHWCHIERDCVSNHRRLVCLRNHLFRHRSNKTLKFRVTGLSEGNPPITGGFPSQKASNAENGSIWWCYHAAMLFRTHRWHWKNGIIAPALARTGQFRRNRGVPWGYPSASDVTPKDIGKIER